MEKINSSKNKAIILDRDGVISKDKGLDNVPEKFEFIPKAIEGLKLLQDQGFILIIITNQAKIGRKIYSVETYEVFTKKMLEELGKNNIIIAGTYYCPHDPKTTSCTCRKPAPGLVIQAVKEHNIDVEKSWIIGDKVSDLLLSQHFEKIYSIGVLTGEHDREKLKSAQPTAICADLLEAAQFVKDHE